MNNIFTIGGIEIHNCDYPEILQFIGKSVDSGKKIHIVTVNPEMMVNAFKDEKFYGILKSADLKTADGIGIIWASEYLSKPYEKNIFSRSIQFIGNFIKALSPSQRKKIKERVTGADLMPEVIRLSAEKGFRIFLLGADPGVAEVAAKKLEKKYPNAIIAGTYSASADEKHDSEACEIINKSKTDILFVAFGSPKQELWIKRNLEKLNTVKVAIGVGGAFDFHAGKIKRAPLWMRKTGLEWLWRLFLQPSRIKRIWNATFVFMRLIMKEKKKLQ